MINNKFYQINSLARESKSKKKQLLITQYHKPIFFYLYKVFIQLSLAKAIRVQSMAQPNITLNLIHLIPTIFSPGTQFFYFISFYSTISAQLGWYQCNRCRTSTNRNCGVLCVCALACVGAKLIYLQGSVLKGYNLQIPRSGEFIGTPLPFHYTPTPFLLASRLVLSPIFKLVS